MKSISLTLAAICLVLGLSIVKCENTVEQNLEEHKNGRIVGGTSVTSTTAYPSVCLFATLSFGTLSATCGSTLVNPQYVVTAAHCTTNTLASQIFIRCGILLVSSSFTERGVDRIFDHPGYNPGLSTNDISLLRLSSSYTLSSSLNVIPLPVQGVDVTVGTSCQIAGWGDTVEGGIGSTLLRQATVPIISNAVCQSWYNTGQDGTALIEPTNVCAGFETGGVDTCQGDSGGPLYCNGVLQGVTSFGIGCARPNYPGVYTRVSDYRDWIDSTIENNPGSNGHVVQPMFSLLFSVLSMLLLAQM